MARLRIPGETPISVALERRYRHYRPRFITGIAPMDLKSAEAVAEQLRRNVHTMVVPEPSYGSFQAARDQAWVANEDPSLDEIKARLSDRHPQITRPR